MLRHGFVMFSVSLGHDLSDWSRPLLGYLNNKMVATSISLIGNSLGSAPGFLSRPQDDVATSFLILNLLLLQLQISLL